MTAITTGQMGDLVNARAPRIWGGRIMTSAGDGKRSINRSETVLAPRYAGRAPGVVAMNSGQVSIAESVILGSEQTFPAFKGPPGINPIIHYAPAYERCHLLRAVLP